MAWVETPLRFYEAKDRAIQEYMETLSKYCMWCNLRLAQERGLQFYQKRSHAVVLYNTLPAVCIVQAGMYENTGGALPEGSLNSESVTSRAKIELAIWPTRSTKPRSTIILRNIERFEKLRGNL